MPAAKPDTRQRLIDTALELMWRNSYGSVSVDDICKAADVRKGSFYYYFPSKIDLTVAAMDADYRLSLGGYDAAFAADIAPLERLDRLADAIVSYQTQTRDRFGHVCGCPCTAIASEMAPQNDAIRLKFQEITQARTAYFEQAVRDLMEQGRLPEDTEAPALADALHTYYVGEVMMARILNRLEPLQSLKTATRRLLSLS